MPSTADSWGADVPISMPMPKRNDYPALVELGSGWVMTAIGLTHDLDESTWEDVVTPTFAPLLVDITRFPNG